MSGGVGSISPLNAKLELEMINGHIRVKPGPKMLVMLFSVNREPARVWRLSSSSSVHAIIKTIALDKRERAQQNSHEKK